MKLKFLQEGGEMPAEAGAQEQQAQDPMQQLVQMAAQAVQNNDGQLALQVCQNLVQAAQEAAQQQQAPAEEGGAPAEQAPAEGEPVFKMGGKLSRRIKA
jgi:HEAT repeat protein